MLPLHSDILTRRFLVPAPCLPPLPFPVPRETRFWYVVPDEVMDDSLLSRYVEILSPSERQSILQMNKDKVQKGAILARALVRTTLARYPERQREELIKLWTLKEAYVKALGRGFSAAPFRDFTIRFEPPRIVVEVSDTSESLTSYRQFALFELDGSHYAAVCVESDKSAGGCESSPLKLKAWKTLPLVEDECVLEKNAVVNVSGLSLSSL